MWWEWLVETMFPVPGRPLLWDGHHLWDFLGTDNAQERLKVAWSRASPPHPIAGPRIKVWGDLARSVAVPHRAEGPGALSCQRGALLTAGWSSGASLRPSVLSGLSAVSEVGFSPEGNRLCAERQWPSLSV